MKTCRCCLRVKPESDFSKKACSPDGLQPKCKSCYSEWHRSHYEKTADQKKSKVKERYKSKSDEICAYVKEWRHKNCDHNRAYARKVAEKKNEQMRKRRLENPEKYRHLEAEARRRNPGYFAEKVARQKAVRLERTVDWADASAIRFFYASARYMSRVTGVEWHVDHIVPLLGRNVSGLHVHFNLAVVPASINLRKSNKFEVSV